MKAVAYQAALPITDTHALMDVELPDPVPVGRDLLVRVHAVSVNPVDTKIRRSTSAEGSTYKVLGYDASGVVATGPDASLFRAGDEVWYAGSITRPGTNAELHAVDERIVGRKPATLDFAAAAALPLTAITAWELLCDRLQASPDLSRKGESLLVIGAGGGVGSVLVQLARQLTGLTVIATAARTETADWVKKLGAHQVIDHRLSLNDELRRVGHEQVSLVASLTHTDDYFEQIVEALVPQGKLGVIDDFAAVDIRLLKRKSLSFHWELMFTRSVFETPDMIRQHDILNAVADLIDAGTLVSTVSESFGRINVANLKRAHALLESGQSRGKIVLEGF